MEHKAFLEWKSHLHELSPDQVKVLKQSAKQLWKLNLNQDTDTIPLEDDWLFQGLVAYLRKRGLIASAGYIGLINSAAFKRYTKTAQQVRNDLEKLLPKHDRAQARMTLAHIVANALISRLNRIKIPVTPTTVLDSTTFCMEAIDQCFPGYVACNLFHIVITGKFKQED